MHFIFLVVVDRYSVLQPSQARASGRGCLWGNLPWATNTRPVAHGPPPPPTPSHPSFWPSHFSGSFSSSSFFVLFTQIYSALYMYFFWHHQEKHIFLHRFTYIIYLDCLSKIILGILFGHLCTCLSLSLSLSLVWGGISRVDDCVCLMLLP